jgi:hypothetical protein
MNGACVGNTINMTDPNAATAAVLAGIAKYNPTCAQVCSYDAGGILPTALNLPNFGKPASFPSTDCEYYLQRVSGRFVSTIGGKPFCGPLVGPRRCEGAGKPEGPRARVTRSNRLRRTRALS